jgi:hypothetical protein
MRRAVRDEGQGRRVSRRPRFISVIRKGNAMAAVSMALGTAGLAVAILPLCPVP